MGYTIPNYDEFEKHLQRLGDWDLVSAFTHNTLVYNDDTDTKIKIHDIKKILAKFPKTIHDSTGYWVVICDKPF